MTPANIKGGNLTMKGFITDSGVPVSDLLVKTSLYHDVPCVTSAWTPSETELEAINNGNPIHIQIMGHRMPPILPYVACYECPVCGEDVTGEPCVKHLSGKLTHTDCYAIWEATQTPEEKEKAINQFAEEIVAVLRDSPTEVEIRPGIFASREGIATCFEALDAVKDDAGIYARAVRLLNAALIQCGGHTPMTRQVAGGALARMREKDHTPEPDGEAHGEKPPGPKCKLCNGLGFLEGEYCHECSGSGLDHEAPGP